MICRNLKRMALVVMPAVVGAIVLAGGAQADTLVVTNGNFSSYSGPATPGTSGDTFAGASGVNPTNWSGGNGLIFVTNAPGINSGIYLPVYGPTGGTQASPSNPFPAPPPGGNFVEADGNPSFESGFSYHLSGLTVGKTYTLSFFQAGGQQTGFGNGLKTTEQWIVGLGTSGFSAVFGNGPADPYYGGHDSTYTFGDSNGSVAVSPLMTTPSGGVTPWQQVTVSLTADATNDLLSFLAWGDNGNTVNLPPIAFLDIAGNGAVVPTPEPGGLLLMVSGMLGFGAYRLRQRRAKLAAI